MKSNRFRFNCTLVGHYQRLYRSILASHIGGLFCAFLLNSNKVDDHFDKEHGMTHSLYNKHIISIPELNRDELELIVNTAGDLKANPQPELIKNTRSLPAAFSNPLPGRVYPFETAIQRVGGDVIGFDSGGNTSLSEKRGNIGRLRAGNLIVR